MLADTKGMTGNLLRGQVRLTEGTYLNRYVLNRSTLNRMFPSVKSPAFQELKEAHKRLKKGQWGEEQQGGCDGAWAKNEEGERVHFPPCVQGLSLLHAFLILFLI